MSDTRRPADYYLLSGVRSVGLLDRKRPFPGADVPRKYQENSGPGIDAAWLFYFGIKLSEFDSVMHVYPRSGNLDEYLATDPGWADFAPVIVAPKQGERQQPRSIHHFRLAALRIRTVVVLNEYDWEQNEEGVFTKKVRFKVWRSPRKVYTKQVAPDAVPVPTDAREKTLMDLVGQVKNLGNRRR